MAYRSQFPAQQDLEYAADQSKCGDQQRQPDYADEDPGYEHYAEEYRDYAAESQPDITWNVFAQTDCLDDPLRTPVAIARAKRAARTPWAQVTKCSG